MFMHTCTRLRTHDDILTHSHNDLGFLISNGKQALLNSERTRLPKTFAPWSLYFIVHIKFIYFLNKIISLWTPTGPSFDNESNSLRCFCA